MANHPSPLISIVIVNWNGKQWLSACLDSLANQTYRHIEIVLVDNASSDGSIDLLKKNYPSVRVVANKQNHGFAGGNNRGVEYAKGELVMFLNTDTWIDPDFIEKLYAFYWQGEYDIVGPYENDYRNLTHPKNISTIDVLGHTVVFPATKSNSNKFFYRSGVCLLFSKKLYKETGGLDSDFFMYVEEVDWFWRLHLQKKKIGIAENLFVHHAGAGSIGKGLKHNTFLWRNQNSLQMLLKNYSLLSLVFILPSYLFQHIVEMIAFTALGRFSIASTYWTGIVWNIGNLENTLKKRKYIQSHRLISDLHILSKLYVGNGKLRHLFTYLFKS